MKFAYRVLAWLFLSGACAVWAQSAGSGVPQVNVAPIPVNTSAVGFGGNSLWGGNAAWGAGSTAEGSAAAGMSALVQSRGQANLLNSEAAINLQAARRTNMENNAIAAQGYFEGRLMNNAYRAQLASPRASEADLVRYSKASLPKALSPSELDPVTGEINWPELLTDKPYQANRQKLEQLFAYRANLGQLSREQRTELEQTTQDMQTVLKKNIKSYAPQEYVQAKKFLEQLAFAIRAQPT
ncbi:MAG: hypothetical protein NTY19_24745 [Planctomycetota bacterium]|nr:hypothetical protein [Planctomycetota bacterium]